MNNITFDTQIEKIKEEVEELEKAIGQKNVDCIVEECADCFVSMENLKDMLQRDYGFSDEELGYMEMYKKARTSRRMQEGYYDGKR